MGAHRGHIRPLLDKDEAVGLFDIDMAAVRQAPRFGARPRAMLGAERDHALTMLGGEDDVAGDEDHILLLKAHFFANADAETEKRNSMARKKKSIRKKWSSGTRLEDHKRDKNTLYSQMSRFPAVTLSSWRDERLPEMLWAAILTAGLSRDKYLAIFRAIADATSGMKDLKWDGLGHSKLASLTDEQFDTILEPILNDGILAILEPLSLYPDIPDANHWARHLKTWGEPDVENYSIVGRAIGLNSWHQSETATDIRWVRVLSMILAGRMIFQPEMKHLVNEIIGYPEVGDLRKVRPSIRAMEQSFRVRTH